MSSIFTKIVNGEIPCYKIAEDENYLAFLDVNPNAKGHTLCIPKQEIKAICLKTQNMTQPKKHKDCWKCAFLKWKKWFRMHV